MTALATEARGFKERKEEERRYAAARAALQVACRLDLPNAIAAPRGARRLLRERIWRMIEKERLKGARRHWSYDLNRHIALKQAFDLLADDGEGTACEAASTKRERRR